MTQGELKCKSIEDLLNILTNSVSLTMCSSFVATDMATIAQNEIKRRLEYGEAVDKLRATLEQDIDNIDDLLNSIDRANGDAPHGFVNRCDRIRVVAGYPNGVDKKRVGHQHIAEIFENGIREERIRIAAGKVFDAQSMGDAWLAMNTATTAHGKKSEYVESEVLKAKLEQAKKELYDAKNNC